jgi:hypothetical protein
MADKLQDIDVTKGPIDVAYQLQENYFNGRVDLQAKLVDFRMSE